MSFKIPSSPSAKSAAVTQPPLRRRKTDSLGYKVLSQRELQIVREKLKHLDELHRATPESYQREMLRMQYKAELSKELASNLAKMQNTTGKLRKELDNRNTDLRRKMADLSRLSQTNNCLRDENKILTDKLSTSQARIAKLEKEAKGLKRRLESSQRELWEKDKELQLVSCKQRKTQKVVKSVISTLEQL